MKRIIKFVIPMVLLSVGLLSLCGCGGIESGAQIRLEGLSLESLSMEGTPINGLPSDKINLLLDVSAETVKVTPNDTGTTLTLEPSGGSIEIGPGGVVITGIEPEQIKIEWASNEE
jgi:hypothetical protein